MVLLRGVNVGGNNKVPMAQLKAACETAGFGNVRTYLNSGNVVLDGAGTAASVEAKVEALLAKHFQVEVPVIVRTAAQWPKYVAANPFPKAQAKFLHLGLSKSKPDPACAEVLQARASAAEKVRLVGDGLWVDYHESVGRSKLTPAAIDKAVGSPTTLRNWTTVQQLGILAGTTGP